MNLDVIFTSDLILSTIDISGKKAYILKTELNWN